MALQAQSMTLETQSMAVDAPNITADAPSITADARNIENNPPNFNACNGLMRFQVDLAASGPGTYGLGGVGAAVLLECWKC
jgi:hypothetical protein